jgi:hypothetical protein
MSLIFNNVELLGYTHQNNFFGEKSFNYSITKTISLEGFVIDLQNTNGVKKIFNDANAIKKLAQDFHQIIINNQNYGVGKITALDFDSGNWVRTTKFKATIEILSEVPLQNLGPDIAGLILGDKKLNLIKNFRESFSIDFDVHNKILGGDHSIDIEYNADNKNVNVINFAQSLAKELLKTLPTNLSKADYTVRSSDNFRFLNNESYDIINGKCGFNKKFSYALNNISQPFSVNRAIIVSVDQEGVATSEESCFIKAETNNPSLYQNALAGFNQEIQGVFSRCQNVFNFYKNKLNITRNLNITPIRKNVRINKFDGIIDFLIVFDNDKRKENQKYTWENTLTLDRDPNYIWSAKEDGSISGVGRSSSQSINNTKYNNSEEGWGIIRNNIQDRLTSFWNQYAKNKASNSLKVVSNSITRSPYQGKINYSYVYTDDPSIRTDLGEIKKLTIELTDDGRAGALLPPIFKEFILINQLYTLVQNRDLKRQGSFKISITADIALAGQSEIFNGYKYFNQIKNLANTAYAGSSIDKYIESVDYTSDEIEQSVVYNINFKYS